MKKHKKIFIIIFVIAIIIICLLVLRNNIILSSCIADIDGDSKKELILLTKNIDKEFGENVIIFSLNKKKKIQRYDFEQLNPWKVQAADVDGDGIKELSLGVYKTARLHPVLAKRSFLYNWSGSGIYPKWLGSRLSRPFDDFIFIDTNNDSKDELISIEILDNGKKLVNSYSWKGFGFEGSGESEEYDDILKIKKKSNHIYAKVLINDKWEWIKIEFKN